MQRPLTSVQKGLGMGVLLVLTSAALLVRTGAADVDRWRSLLAILCGAAAIGCFLGAFLSPPR
ncbi:hypothetical protein FGE12_11570 [Aggregicoccus sp. 17bor-14]|uniref:hypothetical protein n=1 Tax=Myxococcaceae TaxID=31 RepID=UPI00129CF7CC|nr:MULTISPECIES: hypothetical protein [Myxococcaceae]MBF5043025.1 hypothetical protein [Simulacricoccus sp. 17bor-14]MRI88789.1 hypothetical protein [Aggregicoccus sp. 17bor-14]